MSSMKRKMTKRVSRLERLKGQKLIESNERGSIVELLIPMTLIIRLINLIRGIEATGSVGEVIRIDGAGRPSRVKVMATVVRDITSVALIRQARV